MLRIGAGIGNALALCGAVLCCVVPGPAAAQAPVFDPALRERIDSFVESERQASGIPGIALAIVHQGGALHVRGFGHDGRGTPISADTPFPIGSLTKSFTALLVRQAIEAGQLDADAPVQRYLPWFRVSDAEASARITVQHLLHQTSGFSRADGIAPLLRHDDADVEALARSLAGVSLNRPVGESFEYSNLNFMLLGAVLQAVTARTWQDLVHAQVLRPLGMDHSHAGHEAARLAGMTATHRMWFGRPLAHDEDLPPGFAPTGGLVASAGDMGNYLRMLLADGAAPSGTILSPAGVALLLTPAAPPRQSRLSSADFVFRYGEGWFVGPFGAADDARWHQGSLASFVAWMVLLPDTRQAVVLLINANSELPFNDVNAVMSRLPIGVVNLLRGQPVPQGASLREAYRPFNALAALAVVACGGVAVWALQARRSAPAWLALLTAVGISAALMAVGLGPTMLRAFAPDLALTLMTALSLLCLPAAVRAALGLGRRRSRRMRAGSR